VFEQRGGQTGRQFGNHPQALVGRSRNFGEHRSQSIRAARTAVLGRRGDADVTVFANLVPSLFECPGRRNLPGFRIIFESLAVPDRISRHHLIGEETARLLEHHLDGRKVERLEDFEFRDPVVGERLEKKMHVVDGSFIGQHRFL
jgi:hypothetical protein